MFEEQVSLICIGSSDEYIDSFIKKQNHENIEIAKLEKNDSFQTVIDYLSETTSTYFCFLEKGYDHSENFISEMIGAFKKDSTADVIITPRSFVYTEESGEINAISKIDLLAIPFSKLSPMYGNAFLTYCIDNEINLYGTLSTLMVRTEYARNISWNLFSSKYDCITAFSFLFNLLYSSTSILLDKPLVSKFLEPFTDDSEINEEYQNCLSFFREKRMIFSSVSTPKDSTHIDDTIKKDITFFYTDKGEYYNLEPISKEAEKRGYKTTFTEQLDQKAEIGFYCQHVCHPENARFSAVLLHDMAQGHNRWPNLWEIERWNNFDIGILPGKDWSERWTSCANQYYVNPRIGTFEFGYPKSDLALSDSIKRRADVLRKKFNMKYDFTVLYAPSWENDRKQDEFVRALVSLPINLIIKQASWPKSYQQIIDNINEMRLLHEGKFENVYYIEPEENIMTALSMCDLIVSDESSVMTEGAIFNKPALAVCDWLIPDTTPSRFASVPMDYVMKCIKVELREQVEKLSTDSTYYKKACALIHDNFTNSGKVSSTIMDAIDYYTGNGSDTSFMKFKLYSKYRICTMWN